MSQQSARKYILSARAAILKRRFNFNWRLFIRHEILYASLVLIAFIAGAVLFGAHRQSFLFSPFKHSTEPISTPHVNQPASTSASPTNTIRTDSTTASTHTNQTTTNAPSVPDTPACTIMTLQAATKILKQTAQPLTSQDTRNKTNDLDTSVCQYSGGENKTSFTAHLALTSLGASENDVVFGSDRPSGAITVTGYGQSAFYDPSNGTLNILINNNWYSISMSDNGNLSQANAETAANVIAGKLT